MKSVGYVLIILSFLAGAYVAVRDEQVLEVAPFLGTLVVGAIGVALVRTATHRAARREEHLTANIQSIEESLVRLAESTERLDEEKASIDVYDLRHKIDERFLGDLDTFVDARESIAHSYGLQAYADVMTHFAAGERYLNRAWSASTDGYIDEAHTYIAKAREQFRDALQLFRRLAQ